MRRFAHLTRTMSDLNLQKERLLALCKASSEPIRLDILRVLQQDSYGVMEMCHVFDQPQPGLSHHLKILLNAGLVATRREGNSVFYRRALIDSHNPLQHLQQQLFESVDQLSIHQETKDRISQVHEERSRNSQEFFQKNARRFRENQDLIAGFDQYAGCLGDLISNEQLPENSRVMEIGPGEANLLHLLSSRYSDVIAVDNSPEMLEVARQSACRARINNIEFLQADLTAMPAMRKVDLVAMNMVLHHIASPATAFSAAADLLNPGGRLLIIDLCHHDQDWTRDSCGDLWLGFEPADLDNWGTQSRLERGQNVYLGLRNGFQVQMRLYSLPQISNNPVI